MPEVVGVGGEIETVGLYNNVTGIAENLVQG
jgi:hypothetical protein